VYFLSALQNFNSTYNFRLLSLKSLCNSDEGHRSKCQVLHHHAQFLSGVIPLYGRNYPILKRSNTFLHLIRLKAPSSFKSTFFKISLTFPLHVLFGRPRFLFPRTSKIHCNFQYAVFFCLEHAQTIAMYSPSPSFQSKQPGQVYSSIGPSLK